MIGCIVGVHQLFVGWIDKWELMWGKHRYSGAKTGFLAPFIKKKSLLCVSDFCWKCAIKVGVCKGNCVLVLYWESVLWLYGVPAICSLLMLWSWGPAHILLPPSLAEQFDGWMVSQCFYLNRRTWNSWCNHTSSIGADHPHGPYIGDGKGRVFLS